ncbi:hypothetical protein [Nitrosomonas sp.]|uniref:hypothetical protein n=1 Tax=Nitrosomonas sp. TaxID=42353 RepID=UPI0025F033FA|nr:hypothetical protein [Nitrosomonas sp.]MCC6917234.1 hypothetical protein [Nitrosomonas sp.]
MKKFLRRYLYKKPARKLAVQVKSAVDSLEGALPIIVISYNNGIYVDHCVRQLNARSIKPLIIDNASKDAETLAILSEISMAKQAFVVRSAINMGARTGFQCPIYDVLPDIFGYTDPDLLFNRHLPADFIQQLIGVCDYFKCFKAGFALPYQTEHELTSCRMKSSLGKIIPYEKLVTVSQWESRFWNKPLKHDRLEVYAAPIDTTFAIYHKKYYRGDFFDAVRVAGNFSALHMPWFPDLDLLSPHQRSTYLKGNKSSTWITDRISDP